MVITKSPKPARTKTCYLCDYICSKPSDYTKHLTTAKHKAKENVIQNSRKLAEPLICEACEYTCSKPSDWLKHTLTIKHIRRINLPAEPAATHFGCRCGKQYAARPSLYRHQRTCSKMDESKPASSDKMVITPDTVIELLQQNEEFKRLLIDQNKQLIDTQEKIYQTQTDNIELHKQLMTALHTGKIVNNTIHNNTTNHHHNNQKFNLNFF